jgi:hypothetical protein
MSLPCFTEIKQLKKKHTQRSEADAVEEEPLEPKKLCNPVNPGHKNVVQNFISLFLAQAQSA